KNTINIKLQTTRRAESARASSKGKKSCNRKKYTNFNENEKGVLMKRKRVLGDNRKDLAGVW
ncbi:MAG: hypothetical protein ACYC5K_02630, partial [Saccharofermentanales bacterium]